MAKFNWQRVAQQKQNTDHIYFDYSKQNDYDSSKVVQTWQNTSWPIKGKYHGTKLKDLPLSYLQWVGMNFDTNSKGYKLVIQELECRANNT